jgi:hypothetical protein
VWLEGLGKLKKGNDVIETGTGDLLGCSMALQTVTKKTDT